MRDIKLTDTQLRIISETEKSLRAHKQAFVHAAPSLGKTYVAVSMIEKTVRKSPNCKILLISTKNSITNTLSQFGNEPEFKDNVITLTYDELKRNEDYIKEFNKIIPNKDVVKLIIIDESHKALAKKTYMALEKILDRLNGTKIIAMTATPQRMDGKNTAKVLTPALTEGEDYTVRDVKYCLENNLIHRYEYLDFNVRLYKLAFKSIMKLINSSKLDTQYMNKALAIKDMIDRYLDNIYDVITDELHKRYTFNLINNQGERWFVFYNTVNEARTSIKSLQDMFEKLYHKESDAEIEVRIHLFTNELSSKKSKEITDMLNSQPEDKVIDVILTVDKGTESLHPVNMRGIIQMGNTQSIVREIQQLGRAFIANISSISKSNSNFGNAFVVDACRNIQSLDNAPNIIVGANHVDDREMDTDADTEELSIEYERCMDKLNALFGAGADKSNVSIMGSDIDDIMETLQIIINTARDDEIIDTIIDVYNNNRTEDNNIPIMVFSDVDNANGTTFKQQYLTVKRKFVNEYYDKHRPEGSKNELYNKLFRTFGYRLFAADTGEPLVTYENLTVNLDKLLEIANDVQKYVDAENGNIAKAYSNRISKTVELKRNIMKLQFLALTNKLSVNYYKFCVKYNIDIRGKYTKLIEESISYIEDDSMLRDYKSLVKEFKQVETLEDAEVAVAKFYVFKSRYYLKYKNQVDICYTALKIKYNAFKVVAKSNKYTTVQLNNALRLADAILKYSNSSGEEILKFNTDYQTVILDILARNDLSTTDTEMLTTIEITILNELWKNISNSRRDNTLNKLITITPFYYKYTRFVDGISRTSLDYTYIANLKDVCNETRRLMNTQAYKQALSEYSKTINLPKNIKNKDDANKKESAIVIKKARANTVEELLYSIESGAINSSNKQFVSNSLSYLNISDEQFIMAIVGSNNSSNQYADKFNTILVMGIQTAIDSVIINKVYNDMSPKCKRIIKQLVKVGYCDDNFKLDEILRQLVV